MTKKPSETSATEKRLLDMAALRQRLSNRKGKEYWRSMTELADSDEFAQLVREEFPRQASLLGTLSRRDFLKVLGASLALAGLTSCTPQDNGKILPYSIPPEQLIPGKPVYFASAMPWEGYAFPVLVKTEMGRPIKVDGNPRHPASQAAATSGSRPRSWICTIQIGPRSSARPASQTSGRASPLP